MAHLHHVIPAPTPGDDVRAAVGMVGAAASGLYAWAIDQPTSTVIGAVGVVVSMLIPLIQPIIRDWGAGREAARRELAANQEALRRELAASQDVARLAELEELHSRLMEKLEIIRRLEGENVALREYYLIDQRAWPPATSTEATAIPESSPVPPTSEGPA